MNNNKQEVLQHRGNVNLDLMLDSCDGIDEKKQNEQIPEWKINLIEKRLKHHEEHPEGGTDWNILRKEYLA